MRLDPEEMQQMLQQGVQMRSQMMGQRLMMMLQKFGSHNSLQSSLFHKPNSGVEKKFKVENYG